MNNKEKLEALDRIQTINKEMDKLWEEKRELLKGVGLK